MSDLDGLERLKKSTDTFIGEVFDWVSCLDQQQLLDSLYRLQTTIDDKIQAFSDALADVREAAAVYFQMIDNEEKK